MTEKKKGQGTRGRKTDTSDRTRKSDTARKDGTSRFFDSMGNEIVGIVLIALSLLMIAGIFTDRIGGLGKFLRNMNFSIFGFMGHLFPFFLIALGVIFILRKSGFLLHRRFLGLLLIFTTLCILYSVPFAAATKGRGFGEVLQSIASTWSTSHGGIYGYLFTLPIVRLVGEIGCYIFNSLFFLLGIIMAFNMTVYEALTSLKDSMRKLWVYITEFIGELRDRRQERNRERQLDAALKDEGFGQSLKDDRLVINENAADTVDVIDTGSKRRRRSNSVDNAVLTEDTGSSVRSTSSGDQAKDDLLEKYRKYREEKGIDAGSRRPSAKSGIDGWFQNFLNRKQKDVSGEFDRNIDLKIESTEVTEDGPENRERLDEIAQKLRETESTAEPVKKNPGIELPSFLNTGRGVDRDVDTERINHHPKADRYNFDLEALERQRRAEMPAELKDIPKLRIEDLGRREPGEDIEQTIPSDDPITGTRRDYTSRVRNDSPENDSVTSESADFSYDSSMDTDMDDFQVEEIPVPGVEEDYDDVDADTSDVTTETRIKETSMDRTSGMETAQTTRTTVPEEPLKGRQLSMSDKEVKVKRYRYPAVNLLRENIKGKIGEDEEKEIVANAQKLQDTLMSFGVEAKVLNVSRGPSVTRYELQPRAGIKVSKITNLADDIALSLAANGVRIEAPIPGKAAVGIEIPNKDTRAVFLREVIESEKFQNSSQKLAIALGEDISGESVIGDMAKFPHVLIAGATGSGKSVCINSLIVSLLYKYTPEEVRLIMVDPKVVELSVYNGIPHLLIPVVTDPKKATGALHWAVTEMTRRYQLFAEYSVKNLEGYNALYEKGRIEEKIPYIVIIIDELADLMMVAANEVEDYILRLSQMARAAGMHLVIATQRPSVDVITGVIKANIPSRISFAVSSYVDSKTILDQAGAEKLLGKGDMLYYPVGAQKPRRVQGAFISEEEVEAIVDHIKENEDEVEYDESVLEHIEQGAKGGGASVSDDEEDELLNEAIRTVVENNQASTSFLQRKMKIGYSRAARIMDSLEAKGVISGPDGSKPRKVIWKAEDI